MGLRRAQRRRPGRRARHAGPPRPRRDAGRLRGAHARHPAGHLPAGVQRGGELHVVVRAPHALRHPEPAAFRDRVRAGVGVVPDLQPDVRRGAGAGRGPAGPAGPARPGPGAGLPPDPGTADAGRPAPGGADRALLAHPVGAPRLLPDAARRRGPPGPGGHPRRRPRRVPLPAVGGQLPGLLRGVPRRGRGGPGPAAGQLPGPRHRDRRAPARRGRGRARPPARPSRTCWPGWRHWPRPRATGS